MMSSQREGGGYFLAEVAEGNGTAAVSSRSWFSYLLFLPDSLSVMFKRCHWFLPSNLHRCLHCLINWSLDGFYQIAMILPSTRRDVFLNMSIHNRAELWISCLQIMGLPHLHYEIGIKVGNTAFRPWKPCSESGDSSLLWLSPFNSLILCEAWDKENSKWREVQVGVWKPMLPCLYPLKSNMEHVPKWSMGISRLYFPEDRLKNEGVLKSIWVELASYSMGFFDRSYHSCFW